MSDRVFLPGEKSKPSQSASPFRIGAIVSLRTCPGQGKVVGLKRGKVYVSWSEPGMYLGRHRPESLVLADAYQSTKEKP
jgi:hypothetical protein